VVENNISPEYPSFSELHYATALNMLSDTKRCGKLSMSRKYYSAIISSCCFLMFLVLLANYTVLVSHPDDMASFLTHEESEVLFSLLLRLQWAEDKSMV